MATFAAILTSASSNTLKQSNSTDQDPPCDISIDPYGQSSCHAQQDRGCRNNETRSYRSIAEVRRVSAETASSLTRATIYELPKPSFIVDGRVHVSKKMLGGKFNQFEIGP
eukprot:scaffold38423_cov51-Attheya_sp.AAC.3